MFKKRQARNLRKKSSDEEEENDVATRSGSESRGSNGIAGKKDDICVAGAKSFPSTSNLLSFGNEEADEDVFQPIKSSVNRNAERARLRQRANKHEKEKKAADNDGLRFSSRKDVQEKKDDVIVVKQIGKPIKKNEDESPSMVLTGRDAENAEDDRTDPVFGKFREVLTSGSIPDASLIHLARKQRQMAREMGTGDVPGGYVPLKKTDDIQKNKKEKSRLIREEDDNENSDSGEEGGRFYSRKRDEDEEERKEVEANFLRVEQGDSDEERDDELERWEKEQIRKGVSATQVGYFAQEYYASTYGTDSLGHRGGHPPAQSPQAKEIKEPQPMEIDMDFINDEEEMMEEGGQKMAGGQRSQLPKVGGYSEPSTASLPTLSTVRAKLELKLNEQKEAHRARVLDLEKVRDFLTENETSIGKLEDMVPRLSEQYRFYQEMRTYVRDLLDCFNEKMPLIEKSGSRMMELSETRSRCLIKRRQQDVKDHYDDCSAMALGKTQLLQQDSDRMMRVAEREARRTRRRQAREKTLSSLGHHEGMSSDDEEAPSKIVTFNNEKQNICEETAEIFKDTQAEFCSIEEIVQRFMEWWKMYRDSFEQAYIIHCVPKLLAPLVRWKMVAWSPLETDAQPLRTMDWYISLEKITRTISEYSDEADFDILYPVIDTAVLPRLKDIIEHVWDPTSSSQSSNLLGFVTSLQRDHPNGTEKGKQLASMKDAIGQRIKRCFDDDLFTPIYSKEVLENKATGACIFLDRQFWFSIKVIHSVSSWTAVFPDREVQEWVFDGVINRHVVLALQCGGSPDTSTLTKCKAVCNALPSSWFNEKKDGDTLPQLQPFCKLLARVADQFNENKTIDKKTVRDATKEVYRLLLKLRGWKYAESLAQKYRVK